MTYPLAEIMIFLGARRWVGEVAEGE